MTTENIDKSDDRPAPEPCEQWLPLLTLLAAGDELEPMTKRALPRTSISALPAPPLSIEERELISLFGLEHAEPDANSVGQLPRRFAGCS